MMPQYPRAFRNRPAFESVEQATAWAIAARARQRYYLSVYYKADREREPGLILPISAYVFGLPVESRARFAQWFRKEDNPSYRIVVEACPYVYKGHTFNPSVGLVSGGPRTRRLVLPLPDHLTAEQTRQARSFMKELAEASWFGEIARDDLLAKTGHVYWRSDGLPSAPSA